MDAARKLFREYAEWVGREMVNLPGEYLPLLLAFDSDTLAGCAGLRKIGDGIGEMKRLYVRPAFQGRGYGRQLLDRIIVEAKTAGYSLLRLDTLPVMERAIALYLAVGFHEIPRYGDNPPDAICFELALCHVY